MIDHLRCPEPSDPSYPEDFLLTFRTFLTTPQPLISRLLHWWDNTTSDRVLRARLQRYILLWVHNHPGDFEDRPAMLHFLATFDSLLQREGSSGSRRLLHLACSTKARPRSVTTNYHLMLGAHIVLPFVLVGGQVDFGVFINQTEAEEEGSRGGFGLVRGLRRGDQVVAVENRSIEGMSLANLASMLAGLILGQRSAVLTQQQQQMRSVTKTLMITVTYNPLREFIVLLICTTTTATANG